MLDQKLLRESFEEVKKAVMKRGSDFNIDSYLDYDKARREFIMETEELKFQQNNLTKQIPHYKKEGKDISILMEESKSLSDKIKELDPKLKSVEAKLHDLLISIPNMPHDSVPQGVTDEENIELRTYLEPTKFSFEPKPHWELGEELNILDPGTAAKITGARFHVYKDLGARLERALINFMLNTHIQENGFEEVLPPVLVNSQSMIGTGQLPKFVEDMFKVADSDYYLTPTAEVPVTNLHRDDILEASSLPISYCSYTPCFRAEAGSAGRDTRGLIRQHQFNKVELVKFTKPEESYEQLEQLTASAESILKKLGLPYRVVKLCTGDLGFSSAMTYDIEVWMPSYNRYVEISSCSNFQDFQARRANIKYKENPKDKAKFVHTLNGSGLAIGRTVAAIMENFQNEDGTITIPEPLVPYMLGVTKIEKK